MFHYRRQVQFYETDLMGIVHHSNYLRFYEEARVAWAHHVGLIEYQKPESASHLAVIETRVRHLRPAKFGDKLKIYLQVKKEKARVHFYYKMVCVLDDKEIEVSTCETWHAALDSQLKLIRPPLKLVEILEKEKWIEI